ncbi:MAG: glycosyl hydrolase 53 family protein, partial [Polyangiaceae bacterium]|nr:glycosyl hydrolase 53 family protein [Polyangiaceae bacterium]
GGETGGTGGETGGTGGVTGGTGGVTGGTGGETGGTGDGGIFEPPYILGADISFVQEQEDQGRSFSDHGTQKDILQALKDRGFNYIRLRLFHNPGAAGGYQHEFTERAEPYCDTSHTIEVAQRVKAAGMGFSLDFHYSDTWADPGDQHKPQAWEGLSFNDLVTALHDYTYDVLREFEAAGALPDMVQVGNEITPGMVLPDGSSNNWTNLGALLRAGVAAVNEVRPSITKVMHIESPHHPDTISWWTQSAVDAGVEFDVLGVSCYSAWHEGPSTWRSTFQRVASEHPNLQFMIAEYADNYREANDIMYDLPQGVGTMFWEPTQDGEWGTGLFDWQGNSRDTLNLYDQMASDYGLR